MEWLWKIAAGKAVKSALQAILAVLGQAGVQSFLNKIGVAITIDPTLATAAMYGALEFLRNWLKNKVGVKFL